MLLSSLIPRSISMHATKTIPFTQTRLSFSSSSTTFIDSSSSRVPKQPKDQFYDHIEDFEETSNHYLKISSDYPFHQISLKKIRLQTIPKQLSQQSKALLCWICLQCKDQKFLSKSYELLFPQNSHLKFIELKSRIKGGEIFQTFFEKRLNDLMQSITSPSCSSQQMMSFLNTLVFMQPSYIIQEHIKLLKTIILKQKDADITLAMMTHILIRNQLYYDDYLSKVTETLQKKQLQKSKKIRIAYILALVPYFFRNYPRQVVRQIFKVFKNNLSLMNNETILRCLKAVYQNNSKYAIFFVQALIDLIIELKPKDKETSQHVMQLVLKTVSYSKVIDHNCQGLLTHFMEHTQQYQKVIELEGLQTQAFVNLILLEAKTTPTQSFKLKFATYLQKCLKHLQESSVVDLDTFLTFIKLSQKYRNSIDLQLISLMRDKILYVISAAEQAASLRLVYQALSFILSERNLFENSDNLSVGQQQVVVKCLQRYFGESCQGEFGCWLVRRNLNQCINLVFKVHYCKVNMKKEFLPDLFKTTFQNKGYSMDIATLQSLVRYLVEFNSQNHQQVKQVFKQIEPIISTYFNKKRVNFRTTLNVSTIAALIDHQNTNIYRKIQASILQILYKFPKFVISSHDLHTLRKNLVKRGLGTKNIEFLVNSAIEQPAKWTEIRDQYIKRQNSFKAHQNKAGKQKNHEASIYQTNRQQL